MDAGIAQDPRGRRHRRRLLRARLPARLPVGEQEVGQLLKDIRDSNGATYYLQPWW